MAWFHFCTANHWPSGRATLFDMAEWFRAGLLDLGHRVSFAHDTVERGAINMFWEFFPENYDKVLVDSGITFGIVATELPTGTTFNGLHRADWIQRFESFKTVARHASFIWSMVESAVPFYRDFAPTAFLELGFSKRLVPSYINKKPVNDFCFFGLRTPYREAAIEQLSKYATVEWPETLLSAQEVGSLIGKSKIGISFKQSEQWPIPSSTRLGRLIMAKRGVATEYVPISTRQSRISGMCPENMPFSEYALSLLHSDWRHRADLAFEEYRKKMAMAEIMEAVIQLTIPKRKSAPSLRQKILTRQQLEGGDKIDAIAPARRPDRWYHWREKTAFPFGM